MNLALKPYHLAEAAEVQTEIYARLSPADKLREALRLREFAWNMKKAYLVSQHADWSESQIQSELRRIFLYANT